MARRAGDGAAVVSLALAVVGSAVLAFAPLGTSVEATEVHPGTPGTPVVTEPRVVERHSLLEHEGASVLVPLSIPLALVMLGLAGRWTNGARPLRTASAGLLFVFVVIGILSIGVFYLPSAGAMAVAAARSPPKPQ